MKRCLAFILPVLLTSVVAQAQLVNDGATIKIQPGAVIFVAGNVENKNAGTISNDGKLEVQGNFLNTATYTTATADDSLIMSGGGNVTLNAGASTLSFLHINKTANSNFVTLTNSLTVGNKLTYNSGTFSTDPIANTFTLNAAVGVTFEFTAGREIVGRVRRTGWSNGVARVFNQPNMQVTTNGGTTPTEFTVNMIPETNGGDPTQTEREVQRKYVFTPVGGSGYTADARFPYVATELDNNTEANLVPWNLPATEWTARLTPVSRDAANDWVSTTAIPTADVAQEWKLADPRYTFSATAYMRGAWTAGPNMTTTLNSFLPTAQPYNTTPYNYTGTESVGAIPNVNVVDWVLIELRKPATGLPADAVSSTIIGRKAAFILNTGAVVDLDGVTPVAFDISKQGTGNFIAIRHRNHLGIMSIAKASNATGTFTNDFRVLANVYKNPAFTDPVVVLPSSASYGMWMGDVNKTNSVNATDITVIKIAIAALTPVGYNITDVNMNSSVNATDVTSSKLTIAGLGSSSTPGRAGQPTEIKSHIPAD